MTEMGRAKDSGVIVLSDDDVGEGGSNVRSAAPPLSTSEELPAAVDGEAIVISDSEEPEAANHSETGTYSGGNSGG